jgi:hypothetical protein
MIWLFLCTLFYFPVGSNSEQVYWRKIKTSQRSFTMGHGTVCRGNHFAELQVDICYRFALVSGLDCSSLDLLHNRPLEFWLEDFTHDAVYTVAVWKIIAAANRYRLYEPTFGINNVCGNLDTSGAHHRSLLVSLLLQCPRF